MNRMVLSRLAEIRARIERGLSGLGQPPAPDSAATASRMMALVVMLVAGMVVLRNGWVSDDAHIILRTLDNFTNGYGLRWNVAERVQTYTCPLWTLVLAPFYWLTGEGFFTTIALSTAVALAGIYLMVFRVPTHPLAGVWVLVLLLFSRGFIDFSTSGLENALSHLLIVLYFLVFTRAYHDWRSRRHLASASLLLCLVVLNRMDTLLLLMPAHLLLLLRGGSLKEVARRGAIAAICFAPLGAWLLFSLFYYGFLFPNTAYAKLNTGISSYVLFVQGLSYLRNCMDWDPLTALTILVAMISGFVYRPLVHPIRLVLSMGILLSLMYVAWVGGDHMSVRFLTPAFVVSVLSLTTWPFHGTIHEKALIALFLAVGLSGAGIPMLTNSQEQRRKLDSAGIVDDRNFAIEWFSFFAPSMDKPMAANFLGAHGTGHLRAGAHVLKTGHIGLIGCNAGPEVFIIDELALADPLLARLSYGFGKWRPAHFARQVPAGYEEAVDGTGQIHDPDLREYYRRLSNIIRGDLWSLERVKDIYRFNTGAYDHLLKAYEMRDISILPYAQASRFRRDADLIPWHEKDNTIIGRAGLGVRIPEQTLAAVGYGRVSYSVSLAGGEVYDVFLLSKGGVVGTDTIDLSEDRSGYLTTVAGMFSSPPGEGRIDLIRFVPRGSFGKFSVGHFRVEGPPEKLTLDGLKRGGTGHTFTDRDVEVSLMGVRRNRFVRLALSEESTLKLLFYKKGRQVWRSVVMRNSFHTFRSEEKTIAVPEAIRSEGYDTIRIFPVSGKEESKLAFMELI